MRRERRRNQMTEKQAQQEMGLERQRHKIRRNRDEKQERKERWENRYETKQKQAEATKTTRSRTRVVEISEAKTKSGHNKVKWGGKMRWAVVCLQYCIGDCCKHNSDELAIRRFLSSGFSAASFCSVWAGASLIFRTERDDVRDGRVTVGDMSECFITKWRTVREAARGGRELDDGGMMEV